MIVRLMSLFWFFCRKWLACGIMVGDEWLSVVVNVLLVRSGIGWSCLFYSISIGWWFLCSAVSTCVFVVVLGVFGDWGSIVGNVCVLVLLVLLGNGVL